MGPSDAERRATEILLAGAEDESPELSWLPYVDVMEQLAADVEGYARARADQFPTEASAELAADLMTYAIDRTSEACFGILGGINAVAMRLAIALAEQQQTSVSQAIRTALGVEAPPPDA